MEQPERLACKIAGSLVPSCIGVRAYAYAAFLPVAVDQSSSTTYRWINCGTSSTAAGAQRHHDLLALGLHVVPTLNASPQAYHIEVTEHRHARAGGH